MTIFNVSTAAQLQTALASARGGDEIVLANGYYGAVTIDKNFTSTVTIRAANPLGATFDAISIENSSYLKLDGVHVDSPSNGGPAGVLMAVRYSDHISVVNSEINGKVDNVYPIGGYFGIRVDGSSQVTIAGNNVHDVLNGMAFFSSNHLTISGNEVDYVGADAFKFGGVDTVLVENNTGPRYIHAAVGAHEDFMQFQGNASSNVTVRGNVFLPQNVFDVQGIFVAGNGGHSNILIENNLIYTGMYNAVYVAADSTGVTVRYNTLISSDTSSVGIVSPSNATIDHNIYSFRNGGMDGTNVQVQSTDPNGAYYLGSLFPNLSRSDGVSLAEFTPKAGSLATTLGAYERLMDLLSGGGTSTGTGAVIITPPPPPPPEPTLADLIFSRDGAREFDGTVASVLKIAHRDAFAASEGTISFAFDADTVAGRHALISKDATGFIEGGNHMSILIRDGQLRAWFEDGDSSVRLSVGGIKANVAYDVTATFDDAMVRLYLNGQLVDSEQFVMNWETNEQTLMIGGSGSTSTATTDMVLYAFDGTISDVNIWNQAMTPAELALLA